jgi:hypothetical protein
MVANLETQRFERAKSAPRKHPVEKNKDGTSCRVTGRVARMNGDTGMLTTCAIHRAFDPSVALTASGVNLQGRAQSLCDEPASHGMRFCVQNLWCDESRWHKDRSA